MARLLVARATRPVRNARDRATRSRARGEIAFAAVAHFPSGRHNQRATNFPPEFALRETPDARLRQNRAIPHRSLRPGIFTFACSLAGRRRAEITDRSLSAR